MRQNPIRFVKRFELSPDEIRAAGYTSYVLPEYPYRKEFEQIVGISGEQRLSVFDSQGTKSSEYDNKGWRLIYEGSEPAMAWSAYESSWGVETLTVNETTKIYLFSPGTNDYYVVFGPPHSTKEHREFLEREAASFEDYSSGVDFTDTERMELREAYHTLNFR